MRKIGKYLREVSVVVIGVAITLYASSLINSKTEQRDLALNLSAVKMELEENISILQIAIDYMEHAIEYSDYLLSHSKESLSKDSLTKYANICYRSMDITFQTSAFDVFKNSGVMHLMSDRASLQKIWSSYGMLDLIKQIFDQQERLKISYMEHDLPFVDFTKDGMKPNNIIPMHSFYKLGLSEYTMINCEIGMTTLKETILVLENN